VCCPSTCRLPLGYELDHLPGVDFSHADLHPKACTALIHMINRAVVGCLPTWCTGLLCWMLPHVLYSLQSCCCWLLVLQGCSDCLLLCTEGRFILPTAAALRRIFWVESSFYMGQRLICKQVLSASVTRKSLDVDLTVDENLAPKPPHHYLAKLCNPPPLGCLYGWIPIQSSTRLACIAVVPSTWSLSSATAASILQMI
jgi:hypothetical protein